MQATQPDGDLLSPAGSSKLLERLYSLKRSVQYKPWFIRISLLDRRILLLITLLPLLLLCIVIVLVTYVAGSSSSCVEDTKDYRGTVSRTVSGYTCVQWNSVNQSVHSVTPSRYNESGLDVNYCRDPDHTGRLWCYVNLSENHFDYCDIPICDKKPSSGRKPDYQYKPNTDTSCLPEISVSGFSDRINGVYEMSDVWVNGRGVYTKLKDWRGERDDCIAWHSQFRHWWLTKCSAAGLNQGYAWLEEDARCPYDGRLWRIGGLDKLIPSAASHPVYSQLVNCLEYNVRYLGDSETSSRTRTVEDCRSECNGKSTCRAFTWSSRTRVCLQLRNVSGKQTNETYVSGSFTCNQKLKVGCPEDGELLEDICIQFLDSKNICETGCSRFRAMEECELRGGSLVNNLNEDQIRNLVKVAFESHSDSDWWIGGSDIADRTGIPFTWERSEDGVPLTPDLWYNRTVLTQPPASSNTSSKHTCIFLSRQKEGFLLDAVDCQTSFAKPLCSYIRL